MLDPAPFSWKQQWLSSLKNAEPYTASLKYTYSIGGRSRSGTYEHCEPVESGAIEYVRDLKGKPVDVSYNPARQSRSTLTEHAIRSIQDMRSPSTDPEALLRPVSAVPPWIKPMLWPLILLAAVGLVVSLSVHLAALSGRVIASQVYFFALHIGIFVVFFPAVLVAQRLVGTTHRRDFWKAALRWCPDWMRYLVYASFGYAMINFLLFMTKANSHPGTPSANEWRGFSGHWMAFYSASLAILYSAANSPSESRTS